MSGKASFLGLLLGAIAFSWFGLVEWPAEQVAALAPGRTELKDGKVMKVAASLPEALRVQGQRFGVNGCFACHTRQVGPVDVAYGWGPRRTGPVEWLALGIPPEGTAGVVGFSRIGPDLTYLAARVKKEKLSGVPHYSPEQLQWLLETEPKEKKP